ncbi:MAG: phage tail protein [Synechococcales bacterium]|nr:phage tail protein [Synechococcales bacterium]
METKQLSRYQDYLPAYLQSDPFLSRFLLAFEKVLSGFPEVEAADFQPQLLSASDPNCVGLETVISHIHAYLDPQQTPSEFLPWLAGWVALSLREDWDEKVKRKFISQMVPLYQIRGTVPGLKKMLQIYLENSGLSYPERTISVFEFDDRPHYFQVQLALPSNQVIQPERYWRECRAAKAIIDQEKPAHTFYALRILTLTMQLTQAWGSCFPFLIFDGLPQQKGVIEASIQLSHADPRPHPDAEDPPTVPLEQQVLIRIQGRTATLEPAGSQLGPTVRQSIAYEKWLTNPDGFFVALANLSDRHLTGTLTVKFDFNLNQQRFSLLLFESAFSLEPNLRIYRPLHLLEQMTGNTHLDANPAQTLRLCPEPPLSIYHPLIQPIDGNARLGDRRGRTLRLVQDTRLRIYLRRPRLDRMDGGTRLGPAVGHTMQLPRNPESPPLKVYQSQAEYRAGNTHLGYEVGQTMRLIPNSQWLERVYPFKLFDPASIQRIGVAALIEPDIDDPDELNKVMRLLMPRMQSCTSEHMPFTPNLEFLPHGILATYSMTHQQFKDNPRGFYVVLTNVSDRPVTGKITLNFSLNLNQSPLVLTILEERFSLSPRENVLEVCHSNQSGKMAGNTIIGRVTPYMLKNAVQQEVWID